MAALDIVTGVSHDGSADVELAGNLELGLPSPGTSELEGVLSSSSELTGISFGSSDELAGVSLGSSAELAWVSSGSSAALYPKFPPAPTISSKAALPDCDFSSIDLLWVMGDRANSFLELTRSHSLSIF